MADQKTGLVITAHPGDFVWRAGGAIALHAKKGEQSPGCLRGLVRMSPLSGATKTSSMCS